MESESDSPCCSHTYPHRDAGPLEGTVAGSWSLGIVEQPQGEGCCWLQRDGSRGCEGGDRGGKCLWRKARKPWKQHDTAESCIGCGAITIASLQTIESLAHQTPNTLTYRIGPNTRCPSMCMTCQTTEKDPRQGSPLSAWMAWSTEKDWSKRFSDRQLQEVWKKSLIGP